VPLIDQAPKATDPIVIENKALFRQNVKNNFQRAQKKLPFSCKKDHPEAPQTLNRRLHGYQYKRLLG
jgi:hypothetical protein